MQLKSNIKKGKTMSEQVIDLPEVLERVQDDKELLLELFDIFTADYAVKMQALKKAITDQNFEVIKDVIHSVKGAAGNISAKAVHAVCMSLEQMAVKKDIEMIKKTVVQLEEHFKTLQGRMAQIKKEFGS